MSDEKKPMYLVAIGGSRTFNDYELLKEKCLYYLKGKMSDYKVGILVGDEEGADKLALQFAKEYGLEYMVFPRYEEDGDIYARNTKIAGFANVMIAFWDGKSEGTCNLINAMERMNKPYRIVSF